MALQKAPRSQGDKAGTLVDYVAGQMERVYSGDLQRVFAAGGAPSTAMGDPIRLSP